jgi:hypothetical protein
MEGGHSGTTVPGAEADPDPIDEHRLRRRRRRRLGDLVYDRDESTVVAHPVLDGSRRCSEQGVVSPA